MVSKNKILKSILAELGDEVSDINVECDYPGVMFDIGNDSFRASQSLFVEQLVCTPPIIHGIWQTNDLTRQVEERLKGLTKKFYKTIFTIEVLSEDRPCDVNTLADLHYAITEGDCCSKWSERGEQITAKECADALYDQGSEPGFFQLDDDGNPLEV